MGENRPRWWQGPLMAYSLHAFAPGSPILAAAGLLDGCAATSHWAALDILRACGVDVVEQRVVVDQTRVSGGAVTAGIDFGLALLALLRNEPTAERTQLLIAYDPQPPFAYGMPAGVDPKLTGLARNRTESTTAEGLRIARAAGG